MSVKSSAPNNEKGTRYFDQLDQALCNGQWTEVPELARKTEKHAPQRSCFTINARSEAQIAYSMQNPTSHNDAAADTTLLREAIPRLTEAIRGGERYPEDVYVAKVCLAEIHWLQNDYVAALEALPKDVRPTLSTATRSVPLGWLEVCEVKAEAIRLVALVEAGKQEAARKLCLEAVVKTPGSRTPELRRWTERLLARVCIFMNRFTEETTLQSLSRSLRCFQSWSTFWQRTSGAGPGASASKIDLPRRQVWRAYYKLLSITLEYGLLFKASPMSSSDLLMRSPPNTSYELLSEARIRQRAMVRNVEANYESLLLNETQFPKASQANDEVEEWVQQAVLNWKILSGPNWTEAELGEGGKESLGRNVLDILYRAATKTFHSTAILRYLFTVHAALGEFDLAMHAFNSYVDIMSKGKARAVKTGKSGSGLDSDDLAVLTAAEAVRVLCRYGDREQGEKAVELGKTIHRWLDEAKPSSPVDAKTNAPDNRTSESTGPSRSTESVLKPETLAWAYRAIGISQAHWARLTFEAHARSQLRADAIKNLRIALYYDDRSVETAYALALTLAETRDVVTAINVLKATIALPSLSEENQEEDAEDGDLGRERLLVPVWHLLALCLTAKDEYERSARMCEAAFEQFGDSTELFGELEERTSVEDPEKATEGRPGTTGLVDQMEGYEKEALIQVKISQLTLVELTEGVEVAVDTSHELLGLYTRLFGSPSLERPASQRPPATAVSAAPSKLGGTLRSIAGSIRPKSARYSAERDSVRGSTLTVPGQRGANVNGVSSTINPDNEAGVPIAITVTNEDGVPTEKSHHHRHLPFHRRSERGSLRSMGSTRNARTIPEKPSTPVKTTGTFGSSTNTNGSPAIASSGESDRPTIATASPDQPLEKIPHNTSHDGGPPLTGGDNLPPEQDVRLPAPHPASRLVPDARLPTAQDRQQRVSLLIKIWLFIAGLYLRAELLEDSGAAVDEARQLVESFEADAARENSSARNFFSKGWGGGKSVDALWADVWSAKAYLATGHEHPFEALSSFEQCLSYFPDHIDGTIGLSNLLMDMYEEKIPPEEPIVPLAQRHSGSSSAVNVAIPPALQPSFPTSNSAEKEAPKTRTANARSKLNKDLAPAELNRLAARDRAYMLLNNLTRLGSGWDNAEAWSTLARAHELSKQISKAKEALWWVVELEENEPMRPWIEVSAGGFTL